MSQPDATGVIVQLPTVMEDLTAEWLSTALATRYPGVEVNDLKVDNVTHGMGSRMRLLLEFNEAGHAAGLPPSMWLKSSFHDLRSYVWDTGLYGGEVSFYTKVAEQLPAPAPKCYFAMADPAQKQVLMLLEDLTVRGVTFGGATRPLTVATAKATLDMLARFHAFWWGDSTLNQMSWLQTPLQGGLERFFRGKTPDVVATWFERAQSGAAPTVFRDPELLISAFWRLQELTAAPPACFLHGDTHLGNFYFDADGSPGLLDWAACKQGSWAHDVTYFIVGSLDVPDRRAAEEELLRGYLQALANHGASPPSFEQAWLIHRQQVLYGLWAWLTNTEAYQTGIVNTTNVFRFATAALDLDTFGALGF